MLFVRILHKLNLSLHTDKIPAGEDCFELKNSEHNLKVVDCPYYTPGKHFDGGCLFLGLPIIWTYAILRALVTLPLWIIAKCNTVLNDIE